MRITRIRNDKELGLAKREVDLLKEETGGLETELVDGAGAGRRGDREASRRSTGELAALTGARDAEAEQLRDDHRHASASAIARDRARRDAARRAASTASSAGATR